MPDIDGKLRDKTPRAPRRVNNGLLRTGNPGNSGGKPGRSGRRPDEFREKCQDLSWTALEKMAGKILKDARHPYFMGMLKLLAEYGYSKPEKVIRLEGVAGVQTAFDCIKSTIRDRLGPDAAESLIGAMVDDLRRLRL